MRRWKDRKLRVRGARVLLLASVLVCTAALMRQPTARASALTLWYDRADGSIRGSVAARERPARRDGVRRRRQRADHAERLDAVGRRPDQPGGQPRGRHVPAEGSGRAVQGRLHARRPADEEAPGEVLAVLRAARRPLHRRVSGGRDHRGGVPEATRHRDGDGADVVHGRPGVLRARLLRFVSRPRAGGPSHRIRARRAGVHHQGRQPAPSHRRGGRPGRPRPGRARPEARRAELPHGHQGPAGLRRRARTGRERGSRRGFGC